MEEGRQSAVDRDGLYNGSLSLRRKNARCCSGPKTCLGHLARQPTNDGVVDLSLRLMLHGFPGPMAIPSDPVSFNHAMHRGLGGGAADTGNKSLLQISAGI